VQAVGRRLLSYGERCVFAFLGLLFASDPKVIARAQTLGHCILTVLGTVRALVRLRTLPPLTGMMLLLLMQSVIHCALGLARAPVS
jgi:hypothetical protein